MKLLDKLHTERGLIVRLAKHLGVTPPTVHRMASGVRPVPAEHCPAIEEFFGGAVTCEEMRPEVKWHVLRNGPRSMNAPAHDAAVSIQVVRSPDAANDSADPEPAKA